ncbi:hypothetical protein Nepgr_002476 [Nepenthes gracilis]|uniref:phosphatidylglycerophosphatase n=1 Tax=Nepenthes gracilis TaxID=150966 RepID=A0AAD3PA09_NEPGR|nr:hypothetical protein Nepgr_002476 [Nepenthes gracilis]
MHIEELKLHREVKNGEDQLSVDISGGSNSIVVSDAKQVLVGVGARMLFYPTLIYNVVRNKIQSEFRWWDRVDQFLLLGAVPFPADVPRLKKLGVGGVVTLNEPYETLVPTTLYHAHKINHLVIPTRDYLFAPSFGDIRKAVDFIHENESCGKTTYVHCKAGRGRSTTVVLCYLVEHKHMTPDAAYEYVRSIRPRVLLASSQWQAVQDYYCIKVKKTGFPGYTRTMSKIPSLSSLRNREVSLFDDGSVVMVTDSDLDGYDGSHDSGLIGKRMLAEVSLACKVQFASQAAIARISGRWIRSHLGLKASRKLHPSTMGPDQMVDINIQVY